MNPCVCPPGAAPDPVRTLDRPSCRPPTDPVTIDLRFNHHQYTDAALLTSISDILSNNELLSMATTWVSEVDNTPLYYCFNRKLDIYVLTRPDARHSRFVRVRPRVSVAIFDSQQAWDLPKKGLQIQAVCNLAREGEIQEATALYLARFPGLVTWIHPPENLAEGLTDSIASTRYRFYRLTPTQVTIIDEPCFGPDGHITLTLRPSEPGVGLP
jgi:uncharacterized protein YhbP (UPF0306 family)